MKKIFFIFGLVVLLGLPSIHANASTINVSSPQSSGQSVAVSTEGSPRIEIKKQKPVILHLKEVNRIIDTNTYRFEFETTDVGDSRIDHWQVRAKYDEGVTMAYNQTDFAKSNAAIEIPGSTPPRTFFIYMTKPTLDAKVRFSITLKGFEASHQRLYVDRQVFIW